MTTPRYLFNIEALRAAAARKGDNTGYAISKRTGISEGTISRILSGQRQPKFESAARMAATYESSLDEFVGVAA